MTVRQLISQGSLFEKQIGYSRAIAQGDWIFVSGTTGYDYQTMTISEVDSQTKCKFFIKTESCMEYEEWEATTVT